MLNSKLVFTAFIFFLISCVDDTNSNHKKQLVDSSHTILHVQEENLVSEKIKEISSTPKITLQGIWAANKTTNIAFEIKGDSLFYFEDSNPVSFQVKNDVFQLTIEDELCEFQILKLTKDSFITVEYDEIKKLYKRK